MLKNICTFVNLLCFLWAGQTVGVSLQYLGFICCVNFHEFHCHNINVFVYVAFTPGY